MRLLACGLLFLACAAVSAQDQRLVFEAASIRPAVPYPVGGFMPGTRPSCPISGCGGPGTGSPERITFIFVSLKNLIWVAYDLEAYQVEGPDWLDAAKFDIVVNVPRGATRAEANVMLQNLLADRFQLKLHRTTREVPIYALLVANGGPKLTAAANDPNAPRPRGMMGVSGGGTRYEFNALSMASFADTLARDAGRPVFDRTGIEGTYDIRLTFAGDRAFGPSGVSQPPPSADLPVLFTALTEQLGLRLESTTGPVDLLIVDSALRQPTEN